VVTRYASVIQALLLALLPTTVLAATRAAPVDTDRVIIKWRSTPASIEARADERARGLAARVGRALAPGRDVGNQISVLHLAARQRGEQLEATLAALRADPAVQFAVPDRRMRIRAYAPTDPLFSQAYTHGSNNYPLQWYLTGSQTASIHADSAWDISRGGAAAATSPVVVAVIDTGVRPNHPDLAGKLLPGFDFVSDAAVANDGDGWDTDPSDPGDFISAEDLASGPLSGHDCGGGDDSDQPIASSWHGTRVAGLVGASTDNGVGMAGAGFNIRVLPVRALGKCGGFQSDVLAAMYWAAGFGTRAGWQPPVAVIRDAGLWRDNPNQHPAQIINMSLGAVGACDEVYRLVVQEITSIGVLIVVSAGNEGDAVDSPANCPGALGVAGLRHAGTKVGYSNLGPEVGIAAPAGNCLLSGAGDPCLFALTTTTNSGTTTPLDDNYSTPFTPTYGTSFSSPLAAATAGLMKAVNPALTPQLLVSRIRATARAFPTTSSTTTTLCTVPTTGAAPQNIECICTTATCGAGMLDAAALAQVIGSVRVGSTLTLDGSASAASTGRSIASQSWTVESVTGGAATPTVVNAAQLVASVAAPSQGSITLRLTITDNLGASDSARLTIAASGDITSEAPPPQDGVSRGGGSVNLWLLALCMLLLAYPQFAHRPRTGGDARRPLK
jgi:serine protease